MAKKEEIIVNTVEEFKFVATILRQAQLYPSHGLWMPNEGFTKTHPNVLGKKNWQPIPATRYFGSTLSKHFVTIVCSLSP